jgi:hypothetical protein
MSAPDDKAARHRLIAELRAALAFLDEHFDDLDETELAMLSRAFTRFGAFAAAPRSAPHDPKRRDGLQ